MDNTRAVPHSPSILPRYWAWAALALAAALGIAWTSAYPAPVVLPGLPGFYAPPPDSVGIASAQAPQMPFYVATKGQTTIYLLGALHVGAASDYPPRQPFRAPIMQALAASPTLAFELSPDDLIESEDDVTKYGVCAHACLPRLLPPALWKKLARRLRHNPSALNEIKKTRPWLAALLVETYDSFSAGLQTEYGSEAQLENIYLRTRGKVVGLETLDEQMDAFTHLTLPEQREMLAQNLAQTPAENAADVIRLHRLWQIGDADAIAAWSQAKSARLARDPKVSQELDNKIIAARNQRFAARILLLAAPNRPLFVAIGALHLGGPTGVLALLRQYGFKVVMQ